MHGLFNRAIQGFVTDSYGPAQWAATAQRADLDFVEFEAMLNYDDAVTARVLAAACDVLDRSYDELMEDLGTYLVSHPNAEALRRLLRFTGECFVDFLHALDDLPGRARLAVPDLALPRMELRDHPPDLFSLSIQGALPGYGHLAVGVLRAMADDYGALAYLEHAGGTDGVETISIRLLEPEFAHGREFQLGGAA
ncbi:heme NO-binding domain-containing protein [Sulfitobacter sp. D35]|uniref:heme NO-binding domain-containing protein n=1 Tax=Sulfitobacter sp. D35 TaxID=3083252 RepID=UPI00296F8B6E|nr:heme NO-binding domain-containing protein [Sulfitobacter sp. D35]MDW4496613.1 heme NO-binding domain-containing protein [Sulfitobacter sp. D35]